MFVYMYADNDCSSSYRRLPSSRPRERFKFGQEVSNTGARRGFLAMTRITYLSSIRLAAEPTRSSDDVILRDVTL